MLRIPAASAVVACALGLALGAPPRGRAADSSACLPPTVAAGEVAHLGATDYGVFLRPLGPLRAVVLFADFPDAPATESAEALFGRMGPPAEAWVSEVSYGRAEASFAPVLRWYRLPKPSTAYARRDTNRFEDVRGLIADAVAAADAEVDFSPYQLVYVVASAGSAVDYSPAFVASSGWGVAADGNTLRYGAVLGTDIRKGDAAVPAHVLEHELGHALGLPDLYEDLPRPLAWRAAGAWDVMSEATAGAGFFAWQRLKLGWLDPSQIVCLAEPGSATATVTPLETAGGLKAVVVRTGPASYTVAELRVPVGADARLCGRGVVVYGVSPVPLAPAPIRVVRHARSFDGLRTDRCGPAWDAALTLARGHSSAVDVRAGVRVDVVAADAGGFRVAVAFGRGVAAFDARR